jgi:hypothetical protein
MTGWVVFIRIHDESRAKYKPSLSERTPANFLSEFATSPCLPGLMLSGKSVSRGSFEAIPYAFMS